MNSYELSIQGCRVFQPKLHSDERGFFYEWFQDSTLELTTGMSFNVSQANCSVSKKGVLRGIHFTSKKPGQSKLVTVFRGKVLDVVVDLRKDSPTFGKWETLVLEAEQPSVLFIPWGIGHGFMALEEQSVFTYLCDKRYDPLNEHDLNAFDPDLKIKWPSDVNVVQSKKDKEAPFLKDISGILPS